MLEYILLYINFILPLMAAEWTHTHTYGCMFAFVLY